MRLLQMLTDGLAQGQLRGLGTRGVTSFQGMLPENRHGGHVVFGSFNVYDTAMVRLQEVVHSTSPATKDDRQMMRPR
jgi:hypothetical protein